MPGVEIVPPANQRVPAWGVARVSEADTEISSCDGMPRRECEGG
jgi:hypothetical protein